MDPDLRTALLVGGLIFVVAFALMTISVAASTGIDILIVISFVIIFMIGAGLVGALRNPPDE